MNRTNQFIFERNIKRLKIKKKNYLEIGEVLRETMKLFIAIALLLIAGKKLLYTFIVLVIKTTPPLFGCFQTDLNKSSLLLVLPINCF